MRIPFKLYNQDHLVTGSDLWEHTPYVIEFEEKLQPEHHAYIKKNYSAIMRRLHRSVYEIDFGNHVGMISLFGRVYEVHSRKWNADKLREMWADVSRQVATLPYQQFSVARQEFERTPAEQEVIRYQQWVYLRHVLLDNEDLETAWESISREPHTIITTEEQDKEPWLAARADDRSWHRMMGAGNLTVLSPDHPLTHTAVARQLADVSGANLFPVRITETYKKISYDSRENRFIKQILHELFEVTEWMRRYLLQKKKSRSIHRLDDLIQENDQLQKIVQRMLAVPWLAEVGRFQGTYGNSTVLQRRQGYRQWFVFYQKWIQGIQYPIEQNRLKELIESKNVAQVYEYWCFFEVLKAVERVTGCSRQRVKVKQEVDDFERLGNGLELLYDWEGEPVTVYFNKTFSFKRGDSYSQLELRPDSSLRWRGNWYHFDAKFKRGLKIKEDLEKMHVYQDAIKCTCSSIALYPARERLSRKFLFAAESTPLANGSHWEGVGGMTLAVDGENEPLVEFLREILRK